MSRFLIDIVHIMHDFTFFLSSSCFMVISGVFEDFEVNFRVFKALARFEASPKVL